MNELITEKECDKRPGPSPSLRVLQAQLTVCSLVSKVLVYKNVVSELAVSMFLWDRLNE
jgi:hypothetical protein